MPSRWSSSRPRFKISVFLSHPNPCNSRQEEFIEALRAYLDDRGFAPRTLGVTDYDMDAPLKAIRRLMLESNGMITVAFRRTYIERAVVNHLTDLPDRPARPITGQWLTSPWSHIEPAMAFQLGLPILILRESGVIVDGVLDKGVIGTYMPEFDASTPVDDYLHSPEWRDLISKWEGQTRRVIETKGNPPNLY
ncbi:hypothetical protein Ssi03_52450 [Sphaerisporangium siamense]|uniref:TIR domain-containing protein n=1 Tax=Sphaerisporangium siamense TaxID=795645 RepID=A0A7W7G8R1_9ACTN|nr:hypothetical protein [Sphaerisporangium siamense]MBB4702053.1 hypothetical protein [Sphaerisporangium siamense]GII87255.1 hypothetical protein Ssi03_52450 [Sphaerisporangium siamense]